VIVVDTNILVYRFIPGPKNEAARQLVEKDPVWAAPLLWQSELRNVLIGYLRRQAFTRAHAEEIMSNATRALFGREAAPYTPLVFDLATRSGCTAYDCEFVALAMMLNATLITEDGDLLRAFPARCQPLGQALAA
jgi:predicted nucleic acid-binding protein